MKSNINTGIKAYGVVTATLLDANGNVKKEVKSDNTIVATGCNLIASLLSNVNPMDRPSHMAVGTDPTPTDKTTTKTLGAEVANSRTVFDMVDATTRYPTRPDDGPQIIYKTTFPPGTGTCTGDVGLREVGIFNAATGGTMMNRVVFPTIVKEAADTLIVQWAVTIS